MSAQRCFRLKETSNVIHDGKYDDTIKVKISDTKFFSGDIAMSASYLCERFGAHPDWFVPGSLAQSAPISVFIFFIGIVWLLISHY